MNKINNFAIVLLIFLKKSWKAEAQRNMWLSIVLHSAACTIRTHIRVLLQKSYLINPIKLLLSTVGFTFQMKYPKTNFSVDKILPN